MTIHVYEITSQNAVSGTWSLNTMAIKHGVLTHILVAANASALTFEFKLIDEKSNIVYDSKRRQQTATVVLDEEVNIPLHGTYTLRVYEASSDGTFSGRMMIQD